MFKKIIAQGAEAVIRRDKLIIIKDRVSKSYRYKELDKKLIRQRTRKEAKLLEKASNVVLTPRVKKVNETEIVMEFINGKKLASVFDSIINPFKICQKIGEDLGKLHDYNIIHGDLTTSNMILKDNELYFIDFGLGYESTQSEDKAVDLHVLKEALFARHFNNASKYWAAIIEGYKNSLKYKEVLKRLEAVEKRGRYKNSY